jgi:hypothetical protein
MHGTVKINFTQGLRDEGVKLNTPLYPVPKVKKEWNHPSAMSSWSGSYARGWERKCPYRLFKILVCCWCCSFCMLLLRLGEWIPLKIKAMASKNDATVQAQILLHSFKAIISDTLWTHVLKHGCFLLRTLFKSRLARSDTPIPWKTIRGRNPRHTYYGVYFASILSYPRNFF